MTPPEFSGSYVRCVKCAQHTEATIQWRPETLPLFRDGSERCHDEHLQRTCRCCGYSWPEAIAA